MPSNANLSTAKPRKRRSEIEIIAGIDPMDYLAGRLGVYRDRGDHDNAERMALELMPYCKPKLKSIDHKLSGNVHVAVTIGGEHDPIPHDGEDEGGD